MKTKEETNINSSNCLDCYNCIYCFGCSNCFDCFHCINCSNCFNCANCSGCDTCDNCYDCYDCKNVYGFRYAISNVEMKREEYFAKLKSLNKGRKNNKKRSNPLTKSLKKV